MLLVKHLCEDIETAKSLILSLDCFSQSFIASAILSVAWLKSVIIPAFIPLVAIIPSPIT